MAKARLGVHPVQDIPEKYVVFRPLPKVDPETEEPRVVVFLGNADQISALFTLAHHSRKSGEAVVAPFGSGCASVCLLPYLESRRRNPRAVLGGMDVSARPWLDADLLTFGVPYGLFLTRLSHQPSAATADRAAPASSDSVGRLDVLHQYACGGLGRLSRTRGPLRRFASNSGEKAGLKLEADVDGSFLQRKSWADLQARIG